MSKKRAKRELGPFSSTSSHHGFADLRDAHVVRHQIQDVAHAARAQRVDPAPVVLVGADFRIQPGRVGDVVAVRAAGDRLEIRRCVAVADAERVR